MSQPERGLVSALRRRIADLEYELFVAKCMREHVWEPMGDGLESCKNCDHVRIAKPSSSPHRQATARDVHAAHDGVPGYAGDPPGSAPGEDSFAGSAMACHHANECPSGPCTCPPRCYCWSHTCKGRRKP